jgi:hypothetical protein
VNISIRSSRKALGALGIVSVMALFAVLIVQAAPAAPTASTGTTAAAHKCLVATGSGDPAFVRNFNPYVQGLPSSSFVRGGMYEPLVITTPRRRRQGVQVARAELRVEQGRQDDHADPA